MLPFVYVPLLLTGLETRLETTVFLVFLTLNLLALYVGHDHRQDESARR